MADKRAKAKDLRALSTGELEEQVKTLRRELWTTRLKTRDGSLQQVHRVGVARRQIARLHTVLNEQRRAQAGGSAAS